MRLRLYVLDSVASVDIKVDGSLREARESDLELLNDWSVGFIHDTRIDGGSTDRNARLIQDGLLYLWEDGEPRCMASVVLSLLDRSD